MSTDQSALALPREGPVYGVERKRPFLIRIPFTLFKFTRQKPLGAFGGLLVLALTIMAIIGGGLSQIGIDLPSAAPYKYNEYTLGKDKLIGPTASHIAGTDQLGRDVFSRLLYGAGVSMFIGLGVLLLSTFISTALTLVSGYYVTTVDLILQRIVEIFHIIPELIILIALFGIYGATPLTFVMILGVLRGFSTSRVLRALVIGIRGLPYIEATKAIGASDKRILFRHVLPNVFFLIIVGSTTAVSAAIQAEAGLAIIGFGLDPSFPTWGNMLNASREYLRVAPHLAIAPAIVLGMSIFGFRLLGDALRDVLDPRLRGSR